MERVSPAPELSRILEIERIVQDDVDLEIDATEEERRAIAKRLDVQAVERLSARMRIKLVGDGPVIQVNGRYSAKVVQSCVISLEELENEIEEPFAVQFAAIGEVDFEQDFNIADADPPEPLTEDRIDLGELVVQHLAVALDPYPQKSGAQRPDWCDGADTTEDSGTENPFSVLAALKKKQE